MLSETFYRKGIWGLYPIVALIMLTLQILADNHGLQSGVLIKFLSALLTPHRKELYMKLNFVPFCST